MFEFIIKPQINKAFRLREQSSKFLKRFKQVFEKSVFRASPTLGVEKWGQMSRNKCSVLQKNSVIVLECSMQDPVRSLDSELLSTSQGCLLLSSYSPCHLVSMISMTELPTTGCPVWRVAALPAFTPWGVQREASPGLYFVTSVCLLGDIQSHRERVSKVWRVD